MLVNIGLCLRLPLYLVQVIPSVEYCNDNNNNNDYNDYNNNNGTIWDNYDIALTKLS